MPRQRPAPLKPDHETPHEKALHHKVYTVFYAFSSGVFGDFTMGALPQPKHLNVPVRKGPSAEVRKLDRYGRDPESPSEKLRGPGFSPLFHAMLADLPRLVEGSAAGYAILLTILRLSLGRPHATEKGRHEKTEPISTAELADLCRVNVKTIQRQLDELATRGVIGLKSIKQAGGFVKYVLSLQLEKWQGIEDYKVWQSRQVVSIDVAKDDEESEDEAPTEITKGAVRLTNGRVSVRPGRAVKAKKISVGVNSYKVQSRNSRVAVDYEAVVESGCFTLILGSEEGEGEAKGETKANAERHACRAVPTNAGSSIPTREGKGNTGSKTLDHPRSAEICKLFDPLLSRWGSPLLAMDSVGLRKACEELGTMTGEFLAHWLLRPDGRGSRRIAGATAVAAIIKEARGNWEAREKAAQAEENSPERQWAAIRERNQRRDTATSILKSTSVEWKEEDREFAREVLAELGTEME